jgi:hypothetical protein
MKRLLFVLLALAVLGSKAQSFEGKLVYAVEHLIIIPERMAEMGITEELLMERMKAEGSWIDSLVYSYRGGDYRIDYGSAGGGKWLVYKGAERKAYGFQSGEDRDLVTVIDYSFDLEERLTGKGPGISRLDSSFDCSGQSFELVRAQWSSGRIDYYYQAGQLPVDTDRFEGHVLDGWEAFTKLSGALPLKIVKVTGGFGSVSLRLVRVEAMQPAAFLFEIPALEPDESLNRVKLPNQEIRRIQP